MATSSGRIVKPRLDELQKNIDEAERSLESCYESLRQVADEGLSAIKQRKQSLRESWLAYENTYKALSDALNAAGAAAECGSSTRRYLENRKIVKEEVSKLRKLQIEVGDDDVSSISGISTVDRADPSACRRLGSRVESQLRLLELRGRREEAVLRERLARDKELILNKELLDEPLLDQEIPAPWVTVSADACSIFSDDHFDSLEPETNRRGGRVTFALREETAFRNSNHILTAETARLHSHEERPDANHAEIGNVRGLGVTTSGRPVEPTSAFVSRPSTSDRTQPFFLGSFDASTRHLALAELKRKPANPFNGEAHVFRSWLRSLLHRVEPLQPSPWDTIDILEAHTVGAPNELIQTFKAAHCTDPTRALEVIFAKLNQRFGAGEEVALGLRRKLSSFPSVRGSATDPAVAARLRQLSDLCLVVCAHLETVPDLRTLNYASGLEPIRNKLPDFLDLKWREVKNRYMLDHGGNHPEFAVFCGFLEEKSDALCCDPRVPSQSESYNPGRGEAALDGRHARVLRVSTNNPAAPLHFLCPLHKSNSHSLGTCRSFTKLDGESRRLVAFSHDLCVRCMGPHSSDNCSVNVSCEHCRSVHHCSALHINAGGNVDRGGSGRGEPTGNAEATQRTNPRSNRNNGGSHVSCCTEICGSDSARSCSKTVLVDVGSTKTGKTVRVYAIMDEQSSNSFASPLIFDALSLTGEIHDYFISTLSGEKTKMSGRVAAGLSIRGVNESNEYELPNLLENSYIPDTTAEVVTPEIVSKHTHLKHLTNKFVEFDPGARVAVLIGRDAGALLASKLESDKAPLAYRTPLGWAVVGSVCQSAKNWRDSICLKSTIHESFAASPRFSGPSVFLKFPDDECVGYSAEDRKFLNIIMNNMTVSEEGNLQAPLPFKKANTWLPDNRVAVLKRQFNTLKRLKRSPDELSECLAAMQKDINHNHVERVPRDEIMDAAGEAWYLPIFPVKHPRKGKIRLVYDSAATYSGVSLNSTLLQGPDVNNLLRGVLLRFRKNVVGFVADVESMFNSFRVTPEHRNFMKFFWFDNNDPERALVQYRARTHVFGNTSSPAIATLGLRRAAAKLDDVALTEGDPKLTEKVREYIHKGFYVDDGLGSASSPEEAVRVLTAARAVLGTFKIRLHKILSNDQKVLKSFPASDCDPKTLMFELDNSALPRTLGVAWDTSRDAFVFKIDLPSRPFTKRGVLATINSMYDPLGVACPVVLTGRLIQRRLLPRVSDDIAHCRELGWDDELPRGFRAEWESWKMDLKELESIEIPRCFISTSLGKGVKQSIHSFCDASDVAIGHVIYMKSTDTEGKIEVTFLSGNSRVAPRGAHSVPRLELCAAAEAASSTAKIVAELECEISAVHYYSDSKVVLGYIQNETRRFSRYVTRRVEVIRTVSEPKNWHYVATASNPADHASRPTSTRSLMGSIWLRGPNFLRRDTVESTPLHTEPNVDLPETLNQMGVVVLKANVGPQPGVLDGVYRRNGRWHTALRIAALVLKLVCVIQDRVRMRLGTSLATREGLDFSNYARDVLVRDAQRAAFKGALSSLESRGRLPESHPLAALCPVIGLGGVIEVGGRLSNAEMPFSLKHPQIVPEKHVVSACLITHYHVLSGHQGQHITQGALRSAGFYLENGRRQLKNFIKSCAVCRRLRARGGTQLMADLPVDRVTVTAPFIATGMDVMGPFSVAHGLSSRRSSGTRKCWILVLVCMSSRAVHVEILPHMDTSTVKNALRRFLALRGGCRLLRCDRGTNFVGASNQAEIVDLSRDLMDRECKFEFNPPHASHFGGSWERKIGQIRRAMEFTLLRTPRAALSMDEFSTLIQEAASIVNSTPLWQISEDPNDPVPMSPQQLLTLKCPNPALEVYDSKDLLNYGKYRWKRVQFLTDIFWAKWREFYLQDLQLRRKWQEKKRSVSVGDVVLIREPNCKRNEWPMGVIDSVKLSSDGLVRSARVRTIGAGKVNRKRVKYLERPICELVVLIESVCSRI